MRKAILIFTFLSFMISGQGQLAAAGSTDYATAIQKMLDEAEAWQEDVEADGPPRGDKDRALNALKHLINTLKKMLKVVEEGNNPYSGSLGVQVGVFEAYLKKSHGITFTTSASYGV